MRVEVHSTDRAAVLRAVLDDPADDLARLAFADLLDEGGDTSGHAELIRAGVRLAALGPAPPAFCRNAFVFPIDCPCAFHVWKAAHGRLFAWEGLLINALRGRPPFKSLHWDRGFISEATCTMAEWLEHGPAVARANPVSKVTITDKEPHDLLVPDGAWGWYQFALTFDGHHHVKKMVCKHMTGHVTPYVKGNGWHRFATRDAAVAALSNACVTWARSKSIE